MHGERLKVGVVRIAMAVMVLVAGILTTRPDLLAVEAREKLASLASQKRQK